MLPRMLQCPEVNDVVRNRWGYQETPGSGAHLNIAGGLLQGVLDQRHASRGDVGAEAVLDVPVITHHSLVKASLQVGLRKWLSVEALIRVLCVPWCGVLSD